MRTLKLVGGVALLLLSSAAWADQYAVTYGWTDPTVYIPSDSKSYEAKYRINGGAETVIPNLTVPGGSINLTVTPGQTIEVAGRAKNGTTNPLYSEWSSWATATAQYGLTQPANQTGMTITVIRTGP